MNEWQNRPFLRPVGSLPHLTLWLAPSVPSGSPFCKFLVPGRFSFMMPAVSPEFPGENSICRSSPLGARLCCPRFRSDAFYSPAPGARGTTGSQREQQASGSPLSSASLSEGGWMLGSAVFPAPCGSSTTYSCVTLGWSCHFSLPCTVHL